ncbi:MAG: cyclase family protein [Sphingomonadales bacterium]|nr:cyclase family protein [Sphingomonadales bacterium]MDE2169050.1 cyclase family protein [Sphingomonadales bacterium]
MCGSGKRLVELNHIIEEGMVTYKGLPGPVICDFLAREASQGLYEGDTTFQIGRIDMVSNTGTYLDTPFHRWADGADLAGVALDQVTDLPGLVVRHEGPAIGPEAFAGLDVKGKAVLVHTGWDRHWRTEAYQSGHPFLTAEAAEHLRDAGAALVGIDSHNIDDTSGKARPVHTILLRAGIPIVEHLTGLDALPRDGFVFNAPPPRVKGMGTFPVRAHAILPG